MKISFQESGGFTGLLRGCELDLKQLAPAEAALLESLVDQAHIQSSINDHSPKARDAAQYEITIQKEDETHRLSFDDLKIPAQVKPLLKFLQKCAKPQPVR